MCNLRLRKMCYSSVYDVCPVWAATSAAKSTTFFSMPSPRLNRVNLLTWMFSPKAATVSLTTSLINFVSSLIKGCSNKASSHNLLFNRPSTILARTASGLLAKSSFPNSMALSASTNEAGTSSTLTAVTRGQAAICMATSLTSSLNFSDLATKSVSQLISTNTPMIPL
ncbi:hypothetical protein Mapa_013526 [Marchantia paleacea]|nr:hypothetical protein Mapa_013526 [Marchantia paleacea]